MPVWHASTAKINMRTMRPTAVETWGQKVVKKAQGRLQEFLEGVGAGQNYWTMGQTVIHLRRRLSDAEMALIDPAWMALPAIDEA